MDPMKCQKLTRTSQQCSRQKKITDFCKQHDSNSSSQNQLGLDNRSTSTNVHTPHQHATISLKPEVLDRVIGMIYGAMYGDALGAPHEFRKDPIQPEELTMQPLRRFNRFQQKWSESSPGQFTDDTEMAMTLLRYLIKYHWQYDPSQVIMEYLHWANSKTKFMGRNTKDLLKGVSTRTGYLNRFSKKFKTPDLCEQALSNGALMRSYPIALLGIINGLSYALEVAELDCRLTNPSHLAIETEKQYITSLIKTLQGSQKEEIIGSYDLSVRPDIHVNKGKCTHALFCSYYGLHSSESYDDSIKHVILLGGDTDTNGAISGALFGAFYGFQQMSQSKEFTSGLEIIMNRKISDGDFPRPVEYAPSVMTSLIEQLNRETEGTKEKQIDEY